MSIFSRFDTWATDVIGGFATRLFGFGDSGSESSFQQFDHANSSANNMEASSFESSFSDINPANGLPMIDDTGIDVMGNPFGADFSDDWGIGSSDICSFDDSSSWTSGHDDSFMSGTDW